MTARKLPERMLHDATIDAYRYPVPIARKLATVSVELALPLEAVEQLNEITATSGKTREQVIQTGVRAFHRALFGY
jgi:hypothetical protein